MEEYTLIEHLEELRKRVIIVTLVFVVTLAIGFYYSPQVLQYMKSQEVATQVEWNIFNYTDGIIIYLQCALILSLALTIPVAMYQTWKFMMPGLSEKEQKNTILFIPAAFFLFLAGVSFGYFVLFPIMLDFMQNINASIGAVETYGMKQYFSFMFGLILPVAAIFELPVIIGFLTKIGVVNAQMLKKSRKIAYLLLIVIGVSITPPDFISDFLLIIPMILLFEISIMIAASIEKRERKKLKAVQQNLEVE